MKIETYTDLIQSGSLPQESVTGLVGRIIRGKQPKDFETLSDDPNRKIVMLVDSSGLNSLLGKTGYEMLVEIGYEPEYLEHKVKEGNQFKLVVFPEGQVAKLATWDNVLEMVAEIYPNIRELIRYSAETLKNTSFQTVEANAGYRFLDVEKVGAGDSRFMTYERLCQKTNASFVDLRAFLYFTVHLREQYSGDGFTYEATGRRGVPEYIIPNKKLLELGKHSVVDINVKLPSSTNVSTSGNTTKPRKNIMNAKGNNVQLLVIDPQNDFMDQPKAALPVVGAVSDMQRLATMVDRVGVKLKKIHVTLDSHHRVDIGHPTFWRDQNGQSPDPMTIIMAESIKDGTWTPKRPELRSYAITYAENLEKSGKHMLMVWPIHCEIGKPGYNVQADLASALDRWSEARVRNIDFVTKGTNVLTEHYGALMAEVPIANDPSTQLNGRFLQMLQEADIIVVAGEASSHCVKATVEQVADNIGEEHIKKFRLLTDAMSPVPAIIAPDGSVIVDFPAIADQFLQDMAARGMTLTNTVDFLA